MARQYKEPRAGRFEWHLKQALEGAKSPDGSLSGAAATTVMKNVPVQDIPASLTKELTWQVPTNDITSGGSNPLTDFWDKQINPFAIDTANPALGLIDTGDNQFTPGGQLGADLLLMGIGFEMWGEPECWVLPGVSVTTDEADGTTGVSPDAFLGEDVVSATAGRVGAKAIPAILDCGRYTWRAAENFIEGYNFVFRVAQTVRLIDDSASNMASCGTKRVNMGMSRCDVDTPLYVQRANLAYRSLPGFTNRQFLAQNAVRDGFDPVGGLSTYIPSRAGDFSKVAFGSTPPSKLYTNPCARYFDNPLYMEAGKPFQMFLEQTGGGNTFVNRFLADMGSTFNGEMTASTTDASTFAFGGTLAGGFGGTSGVAFNEWNSRAAVPAVAAHHMTTARQVLKWGQLRMRICLYGALLVDQALTKMVTSAMISGVKSGGYNGIHTDGSGNRVHLGGVIDAQSMAV